LKRKVVYLLPLSVVVCLLALIAPVSTLAQGTMTPKIKTGPKSTVAPKAEIASQPESMTKSEKTAAIGYLSPLEKEIIDEMNLARAEPQKYAAFVKEYKSYYDGARLTIPGRKKALVTAEGIAAVDEAINFLRAATPLSVLDIAKGVSLAAKDHASDLALKGLTGHTGSDGSLPNARVDRYGNWEGAIGETVLYEVSTARQMVIALIIDDGVPNRGHRRNIFDANYHIAGVSITNSPANGARCVVDYVGGFREKAANAQKR
jgi:uncharacterized protein YkwD